MNARVARGLPSSIGVDLMKQSYVGNERELMTGYPLTAAHKELFESLGGAPVETDDWGLDVVVSGSQKAFIWRT